MLCGAVAPHSPIPVASCLTRFVFGFVLPEPSSLIKPQSRFAEVTARFCTLTAACSTMLCQEWPQAREHVQLLPMTWDRNNSFYSESLHCIVSNQDHHSVFFCVQGGP